MKSDDGICSVRLSVAECNILLGSVSTFSGVPFVRVRKPEISKRDLEGLDLLHDALLDLRKKCSQPGEVDQPHQIPIHDCRRILEILDQCRREYAGDPLDLRIHLNASSDNDLEMLSEKLRRAIGLAL